MNIVEREIVQCFVKPSKQERILWELGSSKKRESVIWKFSGPNIFKPECLQPAEVASKESVFQLGRTQTVYYLGESYIGEMTLDEAVEKALDGERCIIYCGKGAGYYQGEHERGNTPRYWLRYKDFGRLSPSKN